MSANLVSDDIQLAVERLISADLILLPFTTCDEIEDEFFAPLIEEGNLVHLQFLVEKLIIELKRSAFAPRLTEVEMMSGADGQAMDISLLNPEYYPLDDELRNLMCRLEIVLERFPSLEVNHDLQEALVSLMSYPDSLVQKDAVRLHDFRF